MNEAVIERLKTFTIFRDFDSETLLKVFSGYAAPVKIFTEGQLVMMRGDAVEAFMIILEGRLAAQIQGLNGKILRVEVLKSSDIIASGILFSHDNRLPVSLYAETEVRVLSIPKEAVFKLCQLSTDFMQGFFTDMGDKISMLAEKIRLFQFNTIRQKIAGYLIGLTSERGLSSVKLLHNKETLAEIMGVTRPSLSREFSNLAKEGLIEVNGKNVTILDSEGLKSVLFEE